MNKMNKDKVIELEGLCAEYYKYVFNENQDRIEDLTPEEIEEWVEQDFKFRAVNDEIQFYNWCYKTQELDINKLLNIHSICHIIKHIQKWYKENYGEDSIMDYKDFTPRYILNNFAYVTLYAMPMEDLKELLEIKDTIIQN
jgi:hypothetical protein